MGKKLFITWLKYVKKLYSEGKFTKSQLDYQRKLAAIDYRNWLSWR